MSRQSFTLQEVAELCSATLEGDATVCISEVDSLKAAGPNAISFLDNPRYLKAMRESQAAAIFVSPTIPREESKNYLVTENPSQAFQYLLEQLCKDKLPPTAFVGIHPTAVIADGVELGDDVHIGPYVTVDRGAKIGARSHIAAHCFIGAGVEIGKDCRLHPSVCIREGCRLGERVICQPGAVIGSCGFGYHTDSRGQHSKLLQLGIVVIEDDVEIGANTCIDRARFQETRIGKGSKIDNLVQIGHNVNTGAHCIICGQSGLAGSVDLEDNVTLAGQVAVAGHLKLAKGVVIAGRGAVIKSLNEAGVYAGVPVTPQKEQYKMQLQMRQLSKYADKIKELEKRIAELES